MGIEENKEVVRRFIEAMNTGELSILDEIMTGEFIMHNLVSGKDGDKESVIRNNTNERNHLSDFHVEIDDIIAEGDRVNVRQTFSARQTGIFHNMAATGNTFKVSRFVTFRLENGKLAKGWILIDLLSQYQQLGALPSVEEIEKYEKGQLKGVERNIDVVRRLFEEIRNGQNYTNAHELIHSDFSYSGPNRVFIGAEGFKENNIMWRTAFPDLKRTIIQIQEVGDDEVLVLDEFDGTFQGKFDDFEPTGKHVTHTMAHFFRFKEGKVVEMIPLANMQNMFQQMGISPIN